MSRTAQASGSVAVAIALALPFIGQFEGVRLNPYKDSGGKLTVCFGETNVAMHHYSLAQCKAILRTSEAARAVPVIRCVPQLGDKTYQLAASISLAYNIGVGKFCKSEVANDFRDDNDIAACEAFSKFDTVHGRPIAGLTRRRAAERKLCEAGVVAGAA